MTDLQRRIGNRAVQRLLTAQREPTAEQEREFAGYVKQNDWTSAAWVLDGWTPDDIAVRIKLLSAAQQESLNEGAWHGGKAKVDAAVRADNRAAAVKGAMRMLIWHRRWDDAAKQLNELKDRVAVNRALNDLLKSGRITNEQRDQLVDAPARKLLPGDTMTVDGVVYVVLAGEVRSGGEPALQNNNPGALKGSGLDDFGWGSIGVDPQGFLIFPDTSTGENAAVKNLEYKFNKHPEWSIFDLMKDYARGPKDRPDEYADRIADTLNHAKQRKAPITRATKLSEVKDEIGSFKSVIIKTEKGKDSTMKVAYDSLALPKAVRDRLPR